MTPQERQMLVELFDRIRTVAVNPRDAEAEAFIAEAVREQPYAPYVLAQTALVQRQALDAAAQRIQALEARLAPPAAPTSFLGNLGRSLLGAGPSTPGQPSPGAGYEAGADPRAADPPPPRAPAYAPPPPAGPWGAPPAAPGGGFLASAVTTATGVAGGMLAASAIEHLLLGGRGGLFGGPAGFFGGGLGAGALGGETTINNFYDSAPGSAAAPADVALPDNAPDQGAFLDSADYDGGGGFDDGSGGGFDV